MPTKNMFFLLNSFCKGTLISVFKDNMSLRSHETVEIISLIIKFILLVDGRILIRKNSGSKNIRIRTRNTGFLPPSPPPSACSFPEAKPEKVTGTEYKFLDNNMCMCQCDCTYELSYRDGYVSHFNYTFFFDK
jgi:hypothetical protein